MILYATSFSETELNLAKAIGGGAEIAYTTSRELDEFENTRAQSLRYLSGAAGKSIHGACLDMNYSTTDGLIRNVVQHRFSQSVGIAHELGSPCVVLHSSYNKFESKNQDVFRRWLDRCEIFWSEFLPIVPVGVTVVVENVAEDSPEVFLRQLEIVKKYGGGCCFDIGHAACNSNVPILEWVDALGHGIDHVHMHDNDTLRDRHWPLGQGIIPIEKIVCQLKRYLDDDVPCVLECGFSQSYKWLEENGIEMI